MKSKPSSLYWCKNCGVPLLKKTCENCGYDGHKICSDLKPMFKEECEFLERETGKKLPGKGWRDGLWMRYKTIWSNGRRIFRLSSNGKPAIIKKYPFNVDSDHTGCRPTKEILYRANKSTLDVIEHEAISFIQQIVKEYPERKPVVSFSGGKDSMVISHLVRKALQSAEILHIFGDTTIEYPDTYEYIKNFKEKHPQIPVVEVKAGVGFIDMCKRLEPPTMINHWCCNVFKTGPISNFVNKINNKDNSKGIISFEGIRRKEGTARRNYQRIYNSKKVSSQISARPIIEWTELYVWLCILKNHLDFNEIYKKGFTREGCMYCPSNSPYTDFLLKKNYPNLFNTWYSFLKRSAREIGKKNPDDYIESGAWKIHIGISNKTKRAVHLDKQLCPRSADITQYSFNKPFFPIGLEVFKPFGELVHIEGSLESAIGTDSEKISGRHIIVKDIKTNMPLFGFQKEKNSSQICVTPFKKRGFRQLKNQIERQLRKFQVCVSCGACVGVCPTGAININPHFRVDEEKCIHCGRCLSTKYLKGGCVALNLRGVS